MQNLSLYVTPDEAETIESLRKLHPSNRERVTRLIRRLLGPENNKEINGG